MKKVPDSLSFLTSTLQSQELFRLIHGNAGSSAFTTPLVRVTNSFFPLLCLDKLNISFLYGTQPSV